MKKDIKFLNQLEDSLGNINNKKKTIILSKYRNIINEEKKSGKRITDIIKKLGDPVKVAESEINNLESKTFLKTIFIKKDELEKAKKENEIVQIPIKEEYKLELDKIRIVLRFRANHKEIKKIDNICTNDQAEKYLNSKYITSGKYKEKKSKSAKTKKIRKFKYNIKNLFNKITFKKFKFKKLGFKRKDTPKEIIKEIVEDSKESISSSVDAVVEHHIFEKKSTRIIRGVFKAISVVFIVILLFILLWTTVLFTSSLFALLEGIKFYGVNISLFGVSLLCLWMLVLFNRFVFNKKNSFKWALISVIVIFIMIGIGVSLAIQELYNVKSVDDVSEKYSMVKNSQKYKLYSDINKPLYVHFNSNYDTKYTIDYDEKLKDEIRLEVGYYECYYDFYSKKSSNTIYVSLSQDTRDKISVLIDNLKDGKIFNKNELSRYTVRIVVNPKDKDRVIVK